MNKQMKTKFVFPAKKITQRNQMFGILVGISHITGHNADEVSLSKTPKAKLLEG